MKFIVHLLEAIVLIVIFVLLFLWQLPQNLLGFLGMFFLGVENCYGFNGWGWDFGYSYRGALSLGMFVFYEDGRIYDDSFTGHERGHQRQSILLGPLYLLVIGLPSLMWAIYRRVFVCHKPYGWFYTEKWADKWSD